MVTGKTPHAMDTGDKDWQLNLTIRLLILVMGLAKHSLFQLLHLFNYANQFLKFLLQVKVHFRLPTAGTEYPIGI